MFLFCFWGIFSSNSFSTICSTKPFEFYEFGVSPSLPHEPKFNCHKPWRQQRQRIVADAGRQWPRLLQTLRTKENVEPSDYYECETSLRAMTREKKKKKNSRYKRGCGNENYSTVELTPVCWTWRKIFNISRSREAFRERLIALGESCRTSTRWDKANPTGE